MLWIFLILWALGWIVFLVGFHLFFNKEFFQMVGKRGKYQAFFISIVGLLIFIFFFVLWVSYAF